MNVQIEITKYKLGPHVVSCALIFIFSSICVSFGHTQIVGKADCTHKCHFYRYKMSRGFIKGVSGGCFVLINK